MSEPKILIVTAKGATADRASQPDAPMIGTVFNDIAGLEIIGGDHSYCVRLAVPADALEDFKNAANDRGYIAEDDYRLTPGASRRKTLSGILMGMR